MNRSNDENIDTIKKLILKNRHVSLRELVDKHSIFYIFFFMKISTILIGFLQFLKFDNLLKELKVELNQITKNVWSIGSRTGIIASYTR